MRATRSLFGFLVAAYFVGTPSVFAAKLQELELRAEYHPSPESLTTERIWALDPDELNPHRQRWVLNRKIDLPGLKVRELPNEPESTRYGVTAQEISLVSTAYFKPSGPWYRAYSEFPCLKDPVSWFGTEEGARKAAEVAAEEWERIVSKEKLKLTLLLDRVRAASPGFALKKSQLLFDAWFREVNETWRLQGRPKAKQEEWKLYRESAQQGKLCDSRRKAAEHNPISWEKMMEPPSGAADGKAGTLYDERRLLARAPAKRMGGLYTIRVNVVIAGRKLNGRFLIDSGVGTSVISPEWLEGQGILPAWMIVPGAPPGRVPWGGLAPLGAVDRVEIGNTEVDLKEFAIFDTEFFSPPETAGTCCDGVLGTDFLRKYVVELRPEAPSEVKLWPVANFHLDESAASQWIETSLTPSGEPLSSCTAKSGKSVLVGVNWDTGRESALDIHSPWQKEARSTVSRAGRSNRWDILCGSASALPIARGVPASFAKMGPYQNKSILNQVPAASVGMSVLGRGRVFLDFPHGRIWFPEKTAEASILENRSGLELTFSLYKGRFDKRQLVVKSIEKRGPAKALYDRGLRVGMPIIRIDALTPSDLDAWEVKQRLSGAYGDLVLLQWKTPTGLRLGQLKLK